MRCRMTWEKRTKMRGSMPGLAAVFVQFDARQGQKVIDQATHALGLAVHDLEEPVPRLGVIARRTAHGLDEACQRGQRRRLEN